MNNSQYKKHINSTYSVTAVTFEISVPTPHTASGNIFHLLCETIFAGFYYSGALFFSQSQIKLAISVLICIAGMTQSKAGPASTNKCQELAMTECTRYAVNNRRMLLNLSVSILPVCFSAVQPPFRFCFLL